MTAIFCRVLRQQCQARAKLFEPARERRLLLQLVNSLCAG